MDESMNADSGIEISTTKAANGNRSKCSYCKAEYAANEDPSSAPRPLMKCAGCLVAYYCSKVHQRLDWKRHKTLCKAIQVKLAAVAAAEAEAQLAHGASVVVAQSADTGSLLGRRRYGSNTQLYLDQREQQHVDSSRAAAMANFTSSVDSSCRTSTTGSPPNDFQNEGSASSSAHGSMADLIAATPYHTAKGGRYSVMQHVGNPKRARFPLTVIRERRSSIGSGEAARLAAAAAAAAAGHPTPMRGESESEDEEIDNSFLHDTLIAGGRKRPAGRSLYSSKHFAKPEERVYLTADRCNSDADVAPHLRTTIPKKSHQCNPFLNLFTDQRFQLDAMVPRQTAFVLRVRRLAYCVASALRDHGWCVVDNFLGETHARAIHHETTSLYMTPGLFADGQLMRAAPPNAASEPQLQSKDVRSDQIYWFDNRVDRGVHISFLVSMVDSIVYHLSDHTPYRLNGRSRAMIACYPGRGTKYVRHVDNPDRDGRRVTTIYYLNEQWTREHGGTLRLHPESAEGPVDIEPTFDRLLFFWSDRRNPHEVLPAYRNRFAITIWYFDAAERAQAMAREQQQHSDRQEFPLEKNEKEQSRASAVVDPNLATYNVSHAHRSTPRSASCAELGAIASGGGVPPHTSAAIAQLQQRYRLESQFQSFTSAQQPTAQEVTHQTVMSSIGQIPPQVAAAVARGSLDDYSMVLPQDVISKLIALSAGRNSSPDGKVEMDPLLAAAASPRSNVTSPASSVEIDPVGSDK